MLSCLKARLKRLERNFELAEYDKLEYRFEMDDPAKFDKAVNASFDFFRLWHRLSLYDDDNSQSDDLETVKQFFIQRQEEARRIIKGEMQKDDRNPWETLAAEAQVFYECQIALTELKKQEQAEAERNDLHEVLSRHDLKAKNAYKQP